MNDTNNKSSLSISEIINRLKGGEKEIYIRMTTSNSAGFNEYAIQKHEQFNGVYTIIGKILPEESNMLSTIPSIKVQGKQYVSVPPQPETHPDRNKQLFRELQDTVADRDPEIGIPINQIIDYYTMDRNECEKIWEPFLLGDVDKIKCDYLTTNPKEITA